VDVPMPCAIRAAGRLRSDALENFHLPKIEGRHLQTPDAARLAAIHGDGRSLTIPHV
jgi:hypothetical protein